MNSQRSEPSAVDTTTLQKLLPARRRFASIAVTVTWLMAAVFLMLGMEARSLELRASRTRVISIGVHSSASAIPDSAPQRRR